MVQTAQWIAFGMAVLVAILVGIAMFKKPPMAQGDDKTPEDEELLTPVPPPDWLMKLYEATTSLFIEVDREIWQVATVFLSASLLVIGWVVTNLEKLKTPWIVVLGSTSVVLVGVATLFKHRLREFNFVHLSFLQRIERAMAQNKQHAIFWGVHLLRNAKLSSRGDFFKRIRSIHGVMDIYFFVYIALWVGIWLLARARSV